MRRPTGRGRGRGGADLTGCGADGHPDAAGGWLAATELLRRRGDSPQIIVLTTFHADEYVLRALRAGASGFLLKDTPPPQIVDAIRRVVAGEPMLSPQVLRQLVDHVASTGTSQDPRRDQARQLLDRLSDREREVAIAIGQGKSNAEIAAELHERGHGESPRVPASDQAGAHQPGADRPAGPRRRPGVNHRPLAAVGVHRRGGTREINRAADRQPRLMFVTRVVSAVRPPC